MKTYRIDYTEMKPGGDLCQQCELVRGTLEDVQTYLDTRSVHGRSPIVVTEFITSDSRGRSVPASEWDV